MPSRPPSAFPLCTSAEGEPKREAHRKEKLRHDRVCITAERVLVSEHPSASPESCRRNSPKTCLPRCSRGIDRARRAVLSPSAPGQRGRGSAWVGARDAFSRHIAPMPEKFHGPPLFPFDHRTGQQIFLELLANGLDLCRVVLVHQSVELASVHGGGFAFAALRHPQYPLCN